MDLTYKRAAIEDIDRLTETRIEVLRAANHLSGDVDKCIGAEKRRMIIMEQKKRHFHNQAGPGMAIALLAVLAGIAVIGISVVIKAFTSYDLHVADEASLALLLRMYRILEYTRAGVIGMPGMKEGVKISVSLEQ